MSSLQQKILIEEKDGRYIIINFFNFECSRVYRYLLKWFFGSIKYEINVWQCVTVKKMESFREESPELAEKIDCEVSCQQFALANVHNFYLNYFLNLKAGDYKLKDIFILLLVKMVILFI